MSAMIEAANVPIKNVMEMFQFYSRLLQDVIVRARFTCPDRVQNNVHLYTRARSFGERLHELLRDFTFLENESFECHRLLRSPNRAQHGGENFIPIHQR